MTTPRPKILIVDDVRENVRFLSRILEAEGELVFALSGKEAIDIAAVAKPDLILLDIELPGIDGFETLARLKSIPGLETVPVIFATSRSDDADEERGLAAGAVDYVVKPFRPAVVRMRARTHLLLRLQAESLKQANAKLEHLAMTDPLTDVLNRRAFIRRGETEHARIVRYGGQSAVLTLDIDHFKSINDRLGHAGGDHALVSFAARVMSNIREVDALGRIGGEEFAILTPNTPFEGAANLAERILGSIRTMALTFEGHAVPLTVSIGVAALRGDGGSFADAMARADVALYKAKAGGRDRVVLSDAAIV